MDLDWAHGRITDEGLAEMRAEQGVIHPELCWNSLVTADSIWHFALGIGDDNPLWWDDAPAVAPPEGARVAPPAYLFSHAIGPRLKPSDAKMATETFLPGVLGIVSRVHWRWNRYAAIGETIRGQRQLADVRVVDGRFGGRSVDQVERIQLVSDRGDEVATLEQTIKRFERQQTRERKAYLDRPLATYTAEDRRRIAEQYAQEEAKRRGSEPRFAEDVQVGEELGPLLKGPLTITNIVGFLLGAGSPLNATNRMHQKQLRLCPGAEMIHPQSGIADNIEAAHWEEAFARGSGMPAPYDFGIQRVAWLSHLATDWAGDHGRLVELDARLLKPNVLGDLTTLKGVVVARDGNVATAAIEAVNQLGEVTASAMARIRLPTVPR